MLLGKTVLNYYLCSCVCSWYKVQDWFHMPPQSRESTLLSKGLLFPVLCVLWKERQLGKHTDLFVNAS